MKKVINTIGQSITFTFDGGLDPIVLSMSQVSPANATYAMLHGFAARVGDNAAIQKSAENGYVVTEAMRRDAVKELVDHYASGSADWSPKAKAKSSVTVQSFNAAIQMIAELRGCTYDEAKVWFDAKNAATPATPKAEEPAPV